MPEAKSFSTKKALLHGLIPLGLVILAAVILVAAGVVAAPKRFGEGVGKFSVFVFLVGMGVSYLAQTGRRRAAWATAGGTVTVLGVVVVAVLASHGPAASRRLSDLEKQPLVTYQEGGTRYLRHPSLGFSLLHPGKDFLPSPLVGAILANASAPDPGSHTYGFLRASNRSVLMVTLVKGLGAVAQRDLSGYLRGVKNGLRKACRRFAKMAKGVLAGSSGCRFLAEGVRSAGGVLHGVLDAVIANRVHAHHYVRAARLGKNRTPFLIMVAFTSSNPKGLKRVLTSLRVP